MNLELKRLKSQNTRHKSVSMIDDAKASKGNKFYIKYVQQYSVL